MNLFLKIINWAKKKPGKNEIVITGGDLLQTRYPSLNRQAKLKDFLLISFVVIVIVCILLYMSR
jgi:hypothetical protein